MSCEIPNNFSWLEERKIAGLAFPDSPRTLDYLVSHGIGYLITASKEMQPCVDSVPALVNVNISVEDYGTFNLHQINAFVDVCKKAHGEGKGIAVHCRAGLGRTGTLLACYLVYFNRYSADAAIKRVRQLRPGSIETPEQLETIEEYYKHLEKQ